MVRDRGSFFFSYAETVRIAVLGGTAFVLALIVSPARAEWAVKRSGGDALIRQMAETLKTRPFDRDLAQRLARTAPKPTLEHLLAELGRRVDAPDASPAAHLAHAQLLLASAHNREAIEAFARAAQPWQKPRAGVAAPAGDAIAVAIYEGWARALRTG